MSLNSNVIKYKFIKDKKVSSDSTLAFHPQHYYSNCAVAGIMEDESMAILRPILETNFTSLSNELLQNKNLSYEAKGLLAEMLSLPPGWVVHKESFIREQCRKDKLTRIFNELESKGYIEYVQVKEKGRIIQNDWVVRGKPAENTLKSAEKPIVGFTDSGESRQRQIRPYKRIYNNKIIDTKKEYTNSMVDTEILKVEKKKAEQFGVQQKLFEEFWSHRPGRGKGSNSKALGLKQWDRRLKEGVDPLKLINALKFYNVCCQQDGIINTRSTLQVSTFLGEGEHYETNWEAMATAEPGKKVKTPEDLQAEKDRAEEMERQSEAAYLAKMKEYNKTHPMGLGVEA